MRNDALVDVNGPIVGSTGVRAGSEDVKEREKLTHQIWFFTHLQLCATSRKERLEDLMSRRIAKKWDAVKKAKMVRRLVRSNQEIEQSVTALDELHGKLAVITARVIPARIEGTFVPSANALG